MLTSPLLLTPEQEAFLNAPQDQSPTFTNSYAKFLHAQGFTRVAIKIDDCEKYFALHRDADGHVWKACVSHCSKGSCLKCASRRTEVEYDRYKILYSRVPSSFCYLEIDELVSKRARKLVGTLKSPLLSKVGWRSGRLVSKMLLLATCASLPTHLVAGLRALDSSLEIHSHPRDHFHDTLRRVLAPDLPIEHADRLQVELIPRRLSFIGMNRVDRRKLFAIEASTPIANNFESPDQEVKQKDPPRCPTCRKPSLQHTQRVHAGTPKAEYQWVDISPPPLE